MDHVQSLVEPSPSGVPTAAQQASSSSASASTPTNPSRKRSSSSRLSLDSTPSSHPYGYAASSQQQHHQHPAIPPLSNIDPALEGVVRKFLQSEKYNRKIKYIVRATSAPGRQHYRLPQATSLTPQEIKLWRQNLMQDEIASNNPFWVPRWMKVFGIAPKLDDSLLKVPHIKCERSGSNEGDPGSSLPLHRKETYMDLRDEQNKNWAQDSFTAGINCAQRGELDNALKAYSQAIQIDSKCVEAYVARGCTLANLKKWKAAIIDFREALSLDPTNTSARQYLDTTIEEEERHRLNPVPDSERPTISENPVNPVPFDGNANLDNINEIVLDTANLENAGRNKANNERKRKKKKNRNRRAVVGVGIAETRTETGVERGAEKEAKTKAEVEAETGAETGVETGAGTGVETGAETGVEAGPETGAGIKVAVGVEIAVETEVETEPGGEMTTATRREPQGSPTRHKQDNNRKRSRSPIHSRSRSRSSARSPSKRQARGDHYRPEKRIQDPGDMKRRKSTKSLHEGGGIALPEAKKVDVEDPKDHESGEKAKHLLKEGSFEESTSLDVKKEENRAENLIDGRVKDTGAEVDRSEGWDNSRGADMSKDPDKVGDVKNKETVRSRDAHKSRDMDRIHSAYKGKEADKERTSTGEAAQEAGAAHGMFTPGEIVCRAVHADMTLVPGPVVVQTTMKKMPPIPPGVATSGGEGARHQNVPEMTTTLEKVDRIAMADQVGKRTAKNHI
ncbi:hypothetical protein BGX34_001503 [Mortierella sp. NVP85]|nr:hypothetical protein BGX34_001503 [Mortierella sp. NVP85]